MGASAGMGADWAGRDVVVATGWAVESTDGAAPDEFEEIAVEEGVARAEKPDC